MEKAKRKPTTIYLDSAIARAVKVKAALTGESVSDMVNDALTDRLRRDEAHIRLVKERRKEPARALEDVLKDMKRDGLL